MTQWWRFIMIKLLQKLGPRRHNEYKITHFKKINAKDKTNVLFIDDTKSTVNKYT